MSDPSQGGGAFGSAIVELITVHGTPTPVQIAAGLRQAIAIIGTVATVLGVKHAFIDQINSLLTYVGFASAVIAVVWGQYATWKHAKDAAALATSSPIGATK